MRLLPAALALGIPLGLSALPADSGSRTQRSKLHTYLVEATLEREARSPLKVERMEFDFEADAKQLRIEFLNAKEDASLFRALVKLSNARRNHQTPVIPHERGLQVSVTERMEAPMRFGVDFGDPLQPRLFVSDWASDIGNYTRGYEPEPGDTVEAIHGKPVEEWLERMQPFLRASTSHDLWCSFARDLSLRRDWIGAKFYKKKLELEIKGQRRRTHKIALPYRSRSMSQWTQPEAVAFPGFYRELETTCIDLWLPAAEREVVVLDWLSFEDTLAEDLAAVVAFAKRRKLLGWDVIVDLTHSEGGSGSPLVLRHLVSESFTTTSCDLRISDASTKLLEKLRAEYGPTDPVVGWMGTALSSSREGHAACTEPIPYELEFPGEAGDGVLEPAETHFSGELVCLLGPWAGGEVDQMAAIVVDNALGHTIGMPTAGYEAAFAWTETLELAGEGKPVTSFTWMLGHAIRPNGEILAGNPPEPAEAFPVTRANHATWRSDLLDRALAWLDEIER